MLEGRKAKRKEGESGALLTSVSKASLHSLKSDTDTRMSVRLCSTPQHEWLTKAADAVVLSLLLPGPHTCDVGLFSCVLYQMLCAIVEGFICLFQKSSVHCSASPPPLSVIRVKAHVMVFEHGLQPPGVLHNSLTYDYITQKWSHSVEKERVWASRVWP